MTSGNKWTLGELLVDADVRSTFQSAMAGFLSLEHRTTFVADSNGEYYTCRTELFNPKTGQWLPVTLGNIRDAAGEI